MKRFFGVIFIILSSLTILLSLIIIPQGTDMAIIGTIILFIPGVIVLVTGIKMCRRPKFHPKADHYQYHYDSDEEYDEEGYYEDEYHDHEYEPPQEPVSVNCSGCGAKVKVYPNLSADCEYCGTTMRLS